MHLTVLNEQLALPGPSTGIATVPYLNWSTNNAQMGVRVVLSLLSLGPGVYLSGLVSRSAGFKRVDPSSHPTSYNHGDRHVGCDQHYDNDSGPFTW